MQEFPQFSTWAASFNPECTKQGANSCSWPPTETAFRNGLPYCLLEGITRSAKIRSITFVSSAITLHTNDGFKQDRTKIDEYLADKLDM